MILLVLLAVFLGGLLVLTAAALGAFIVYRTKSPQERLFNFKRPELGIIDTEGDLYAPPSGRPESIIDTLNQPSGPVYPPGDPLTWGKRASVSPVTLEQNARFQAQMGAERGADDAA